MTDNTEAIIIHKKPYGEHKLIIRFLTESDYLHTAITTISSKYYAKYQIGNLASIQLTDKFALKDLNIIEYLGLSLLEEQAKLTICTALTSLVGDLFIDNDPSKDLYVNVKNIYKNALNNSYVDLVKQYVYFEIFLLQSTGYGLDLSKCTITNSPHVYYLSPKTGKAVSREAGEAYHNKLFLIPKILKDPDKKFEYKDIVDELIQSLNITGYFLNKIYQSQNKKMSFYRIMIIDYLTNLAKSY